MEYLEAKRKDVLETIKPIMDAFGIKDYDYIVKSEGQRETLVIEGTRIGCSDNSISATIEEVVGYLFVEIFVKNRGLGCFKGQSLKYIKRYWLDREQDQSVWY